MCITHSLAKASGAKIKRLTYEMEVFVMTYLTNMTEILNNAKNRLGKLEQSEDSPCQQASSYEELRCWLMGGGGGCVSYSLVKINISTKFMYLQRQSNCYQHLLYNEVTVKEGLSYHTWLSLIHRGTPGGRGDRLDPQAPKTRASTASQKWGGGGGRHDLDQNYFKHE